MLRVSMDQESINKREWHKMCYSGLYEIYFIRSQKMNKLFAKILSVSAVVLTLGCGITVYSIAKDSETNRERDLPEGVYLKLTREFYESLRDNKNTYSNDKSTEYLREISISSKFIVESNLQIIKQQEEIIGLLKKIADKK